VTEPPVLRIVAGGAPSDEETAALAAVLTVIASTVSAQDEPPTQRSRWRDSAQPAPWARAGWVAAARRSALRRQQ
jgi:hypothetical protein